MKCFLRNTIFLLLANLCIDIGALPYALHTFERPKRDDWGQLILNKQGRPVVDHLHTISDRHTPILRSDEQDARTIINHIVKQSCYGIKNQVYIEDMQGEFRTHTAFPAYNPTIHQNVSWLKALWLTMHDVLFGKIAQPQSFLNRLHCVCAERKIPVENIEFRSIHDTEKQCNHHPKSSFKTLIESWQEYETETKNLKKKYAFHDTVAPEHTLKKLTKKLSSKLTDCYCSLYGDKKKSHEIVMSGLCPEDKSLGACITRTGFEMLENRALVETCKHNPSPHPCDTYLAMGGLHIDEIQGYPGRSGYLHQHGWRPIQQSGTSFDTILKTPGKLSMVHSSKHFKQLPARGSSVGWYERLASMCKKQLIGGIPIQRTLAQSARPITPIDLDKGAVEKAMNIPLRRAACTIAQPN